MWLPQRPLGGLDNNSHNDIFSVSPKCKWFHPLKNHEALESSWERRGDSQWTNDFSFYIKSAWQRLLVRWDGGVFNGFRHCSGYVVSELFWLCILSVENIGAYTPQDRFIYVFINFIQVLLSRYIMYVIKHTQARNWIMIRQKHIYIEVPQSAFSLGGHWPGSQKVLPVLILHMLSC